MAHNSNQISFSLLSNGETYVAVTTFECKGPEGWTQVLFFHHDPLRYRGLGGHVARYNEQMNTQQILEEFAHDEFENYDETY